jgi:glutathione S-transferase
MTTITIHIGKYWIEQGLRALEQEAKSSTGKYLVHDTPTVADACLIPQLYNARKYVRTCGYVHVHLLSSFVHVHALMISCLCNGWVKRSVGSTVI